MKEFDADNFSIDMIPKDSNAITHVDGRYIAPCSWEMLKADDRAAFCAGWTLTDQQLQALVFDADKLAIGYFADQLDDHGPVDEAALPVLVKLRDALVDLDGLDDHVLAGLLWRIPSFFPANVAEARQKISAGMIITSALTRPRIGGRPKKAKPRAVACANSLIESWQRRTTREPTAGKKKPSIRSFYTKLLPLLRVPSGLRVYRREGGARDLHQDSKAFANEILEAIVRELN